LFDNFVVPTTGLVQLELLQRLRPRANPWLLVGTLRKFEGRILQAFAKRVKPEVSFFSDFAAPAVPTSQARAWERFHRVLESRFAFDTWSNANRPFQA
jgi:hypothetical protein